MVSYETKNRGKVIAELDYDRYKGIAGKISNALPKGISVGREITNKKGKKVVRLWCKYPDAAKKALKKVLGGK